MHYILEKGRPEQGGKRLAKEMKSYDVLDQLGIEYWRIDHQPAMTIEECYEIEQYLGTTICKNLFLCNRQQTQFYLLVMPGKKKFQTKLVSGQLGVARLSFAAEEYLEEYIDITPGSVSILGLINDQKHRVQLLVDEEVLEEDFFACHPCINTSSLKMKTTDIFDKFVPAIEHAPVFLNLGKQYL